MNNKFNVPLTFGCIKENLPLLKVSVPGSKSITNRALLLATMADGESILKGVLFSDDSRHFLKCIQDLGIETDVNEDTKVIHVKGLNGKLPKSEASVYVGSAGTAARFLTAYLGVVPGVWHMDASEQMRKRPMAPLLSSLKDLGCGIEYDQEPKKEGFFPFTVHGCDLTKNEITIDIEHSSQFLSALLITSFLAKDDFTIHVEGTHGMAYIDMTCQMMKQFGVIAQKQDASTFLIKSGQKYNPLDYQVEPDVSAACYFYGLGALLQIPVMVPNVHFDSLQGDVAFLHILEQMGCTLSETEEGIILYPPKDGKLKGITVDMSACSDQAITLAAIAPFAEGETTITGIGHIRFQESDRLKAIATELTKMGIKVNEEETSITIFPGTPSPCEVETYEDHRMAMGFSLIGLRSEGITILDPNCCRKTFENYFDVLTDVLSQIRK